MDYKSTPQLLLDFLSYHETIRGHSKKTVDEYNLDLRTFFRFLKLRRGLVTGDTLYEEIPIGDVDLPLIGSVVITDIYEFLSF